MYDVSSSASTVRPSSGQPDGWLQPAVDSKQIARITRLRRLCSGRLVHRRIAFYRPLYTTPDCGQPRNLRTLVSDPSHPPYMSTICEHGTRCRGRGESLYLNDETYPEWRWGRTLVSATHPAGRSPHRPRKQICPNLVLSGIPLRSHDKRGTATMLKNVSDPAAKHTRPQT